MRPGSSDGTLALIIGASETFAIIRANNAEKAASAETTVGVDDQFCGE